MSRDVTQSGSRSVTDGREATERHPEDVRFRERAEILAAEAREARKLFGLLPSLAVGRCVFECIRDDVGPAVPLYISARAGDRQVSLTDEEFELFHQAMGDWLTIYARCYGVGLDADFTIRKVAEVPLWTHDVVDTAQLLTYVPERR